MFSIDIVPYAYIPKKKQINNKSIEFKWSNLSDIPKIEMLVNRLLGLCGINKKVYDDCTDVFSGIFSDDKKKSCIISTLFYHYFTFRPDPEMLILLEEIKKKNTNISDIKDLRLYIWDIIGKDYNGFIEIERRQNVLEKVSRDFGIKISQLENLIWADQESNKILLNFRQVNSSDVVYLYNFHLLETIIRNSRKLYFYVPNLLGNIAKNFILRLRYMPLYYEINQLKRGGITDYQVKIIIPEEISAPKFKYGKLLTNIAIYLINKFQSHEIDFDLNVEIKIKNRIYFWSIDNKLFNLIKYPWNINWAETQTDKLLTIKFEDNKENVIETEYLKLDSKIEEAFFKRFKDDEWSIIHEPTTFITKDGTIFIPDFAITNRRLTVYIEIIGFWTDTYINKKIEKLKKLQTDLKHPLILLIDESLKHNFIKETTINMNYKIIYYDFKLFTRALNELHEFLDDNYSSRDIYLNEIKNNLDSFIPVCNEHVNNRGILNFEDIQKILKSFGINIPIKFIKNALNQKSIHDKFVNQGLILIPQLGLISISLKNSIITQIQSILIKKNKILNNELKSLIQIPFKSVDVIEIIKHLTEFKIIWKNLATFYVKLEK
ncbi:MAG: DUF790 family protein [Candidatus Helarchaeota archaeon]